MPNFDKYPDNFDDCPEGTTFDEWKSSKKGMCLRAKYVPNGNGGFKWVWSAHSQGSKRSSRGGVAIHTDSGIPQSIHNHLTNKPHELYDRNLARQGKKIDPEDM